MSKSEQDKIQAHGLTVEQMKELHYNQINEPESIDMMEPNNGGDNIKDPYFKDEFKDYKLPVHEKHLYHIIADARQFASKGAVAERTSQSVLHKFSPETYEFMKKSYGFTGQIIHILHSPEGTRKVKDEESLPEGMDKKKKNK